MNVLLVEDGLLSQLVVCDALERGGHRVATVGSGQEALDYLAAPITSSERVVDAVVLDYLLGDMTGRDVLQRLRAGGNQVPVLIVTGSDLEFLHDLKQYPPVLLLRKPVENGRLRRALTQLIGGN